MMRKYGLDEGKMYQETNTLLEPNNFIPSWEAGDEEKKEVSSALRKLREKYDQIFILAEAKQKSLEQLKKNLKKATDEEKRVSKETGGANKDTEMAQIELEYVEMQH